MARAPFFVFKRISKDSSGSVTVRYCARYFDEDGTVVKTRALKATSATKAALEAKTLLDTGSATSSGGPLILDFLLGFWKVDSDYTTMKKLRGRPLSIHYIEINASVIGKHLSTPLKGVRFHQLIVPRMEKIVLDGAGPAVKALRLRFSFPMNR
jgi:hypothetical protein